MPTLAVRLTGYWPFQTGLSSSERLMEGGTKDRLGKPLYTLEAFQRGEVPYVSVAGDYNAWPYGQRIEIDAWPGVVFRIVDTGGHFAGPNKVYRDSAREPLDICVESSSSVVPPRASATIIEGDVLGKRTSIGWTFVRGLDGDVTEETSTMTDAIADALDNGGSIVLLALAAVGTILALKGI